MSISDDDDLWPQLKPFTDATPLETAFQVRQIDGGYEIWDPQHEVALASADPKWVFSDGPAGKGVAECSDTRDCGKDRHVVTFQPPLPEGAVSSQGHLHIENVYEDSHLTALGGALVIGIFVCCLCGCFCCFTGVGVCVLKAEGK